MTPETRIELDRTTRLAEMAKKEEVVKEYDYNP